MNRATEPIPFLDLVTPHKELEEELVTVFRKALSTASFVGGAMVEEFEEDYARFCGTKYCVGVSSGTDALRFALIACGVKAGEIVITVPNTFIATTEAITQSGAKPEFVDIDQQTYNMDPAKLQDYLDNQCTLDSASGKLISRRSCQPVVAIVPVHLYGQMANMDPILQLAERYGIIVIEDACQAHGAEYYSRNKGEWMKAGSVGRAAAFSFYPGKNLGACGEAGAVTTNDADLAVKIKMLRDHGQIRKYYHDLEGYNGRLDALQAAILHTKLDRLAAWNIQRRNGAAEYRRLFNAAGCGINAPYEPSWSKSIYHVFVIRVENRQALMEQLRQVGIGTGIHYPIPLHLQKAYAFLNYSEGDFPIAEGAAAEILSIPMFPQLTPAQQARVTGEVIRLSQVELAG